MIKNGAFDVNHFLFGTDTPGGGVQPETQPISFKKSLTHPPGGGGYLPPLR